MKARPKTMAEFIIYLFKENAGGKQFSGPNTIRTFYKSTLIEPQPPYNDR